MRKLLSIEISSLRAAAAIFKLHLGPTHHVTLTSQQPKLKNRVTMAPRKPDQRAKSWRAFLDQFSEPDRKELERLQGEHRQELLHRGRLRVDLFYDYGSKPSDWFIAEVWDKFYVQRAMEAAASSAAPAALSRDDFDNMRKFIDAINSKTNHKYAGPTFLFSPVLTWAQR